MPRTCPAAVYPGSAASRPRTTLAICDGEEDRAEGEPARSISADVGSEPFEGVAIRGPVAWTMGGETARDAQCDRRVASPPPDRRHATR